MTAAAAPLEGFTVAVTAARRREELGALLRRRGARVVLAPAIRIVPLEDDAALLAATRDCVEAPIDIAVATTGIGFRGWMEAAQGWGLDDALRDRLGAATLLARGPKARGAIRAAGLVDDWAPESESSAEVLDHLLAQDLRGRRIVVQLHGEPLPDAAAREALAVRRASMRRRTSGTTSLPRISTESASPFSCTASPYPTSSTRSKRPAPRS